MHYSKQYSRLTKRKQHRQKLSLKVSDALSNEPRTIENVGVNLSFEPSEPLAAEPEV